MGPGESMYVTEDVVLGVASLPYPTCLLPFYSLSSIVRNPPHLPGHDRMTPLKT